MKLSDKLNFLTPDLAEEAKELEETVLRLKRQYDDLAYLYRKLLDEVEE